MRETDFFIVGAPKCGTTALAWYLRDRSDVFLIKPKEPHYFANDLPNYRAVSNESDYRSLYADATDEQLIGEASVFHMFSEVALKNIRDFNQDAKIIVMFRNPVDVVHSFHSQLLYTRDEDVPEFEEAWNLIECRKKGERIPARCKAPELLQYDTVAKFGVQLERVYDCFPRDQVCVVLFEDFVSDTENEFARVMEFLKIPGEGRTVFPRVNPNRRHRSKFSANLLFDKTKYFSNLVKKIKKLLGVREIGLLRKLRQLELKYEERAPLSPALRAEVLATYERDIVQLEHSIDRDLSHWRD